MTETDWLASDDPGAMLDYLLEERHGEFYGPVTYTHRTSNRKLRLWVEACRQASEPGRTSWSYDLDNPKHLCRAVAEWSRLDNEDDHGTAASRAILLREIVGNPFRPVTLPAGPPIPGHHKRCTACDGTGQTGEYAQNKCEWCEGTGWEWIPSRDGPSPWLTPDVLAMAQAAYDDRDEVSGHLDPVRLLVLADSLEEAGCPQEVETACDGCGGAGVVYDEVGTDYPCVRCGRGGLTRPGTGRAIVPHPLLAHLRSPGPHVRGCWAIDLVLEKE